jgi:hypothetical protein
MWTSESMQLTPEQKAQLDQARASGERRVRLNPTAAQKAEWEVAVQQELAGREENIEHLRKIKAAAAQEGFLGDLRRALARSRRPVQELAAEIGIETRLLSDFRAGDAELPSAALDRLVGILGLRLMQEIPR